MTSINTDNYQTSLLRLDSNHKDSPKSVNASEPSTFTSVLANVENRQNKAVANDILAEDNSKGGLEFNEDFSKTESLQKFVAPPPVLTDAGIVGDVPLEDGDYLVNGPEDASDEIKSSSPEIPKIVSSRMVASSLEIPGNDLEIDEIEPDVIGAKHEKIKNMIITAGKFHGVDPSIGLAIAKVESSFNPNAVSSDGFRSKGVFQLLDSTGREIHNTTGMTEPYQPFDPSMNSFLGMGHFRKLLDIFSKETPLTSTLSTHPAISADELENFAIAAYNAGEGNVAKAQQKASREGKDPSKFSDIRAYLPEITRGYVDKVNGLRTQIASNLDSAKIV